MFDTRTQAITEDLLNTEDVQNRKIKFYYQVSCRELYTRCEHYFYFLKPLKICLHNRTESPGKREVSLYLLIVLLVLVITT